MIACAKADRWEEGLNLLLLYGVKTKRSELLSRAVAAPAVMNAHAISFSSYFDLILVSKLSCKAGLSELASSS